MESARLITSSTSTDSNLKRRSSSSSYSPKSPSISDLPNRIDNVDKDTSLTLSLSGIFRSSENTPVSSGPGDVRRSDKAHRKTVDEVWGEIVAGRREKKRIKGEKRNCKVEPSDANEFMTLEDFLAKADAAEKDNVKLERFYSDGGAMFGYDQGMIMSERSGVEESGGGKGNRSVMLEPLDKVAQQRQRRMIKNRESAARSRERKQAYQVELESMVVKLEEENELLLKEKEEQIKERFKQLMEKIIPVVEKRKPQCSLRRVSSAQW